MNSQEEKHRKETFDPSEDYFFLLFFFIEVFLLHLSSVISIFLIFISFDKTQILPGKSFYTACLQLRTKHDYLERIYLPMHHVDIKVPALFFSSPSGPFSVCLYTQPSNVPSERRKITSFIHTCCILKQIANLLSQTKHKTNLKTVCLKTEAK